MTERFGWCPKCKAVYEGGCNQGHRDEFIGTTIEDVQRFYADQRNKPVQRDDELCGGCGRPLRQHKHGRFYGGSAGNGVHTRFGTLSAYALAPRPGDQGVRVAECGATNKLYRNRNR